MRSFRFIASAAGCIASSVALLPAAAGQEQVWVRQMGSPAQDSVASVVADGAGGVFAGGYTRGSLFAPNLGEADAWLARFDAAGAPLWKVQFGGSLDVRGAALASDGAGGVLFAGSKPSENPYSYGRQPWLARYDAAGNRLWFSEYFAEFDQEVVAIVPDGAGGAFMAIATENAAHLDIAVLRRVNATGGLVWNRHIGPFELGVMRLAGIASDGAGGVSVAGDSLGYLPNSNSRRYFGWVIRYDAAGVVTGGHAIPAPDSTSVSAVARDSAGGLYVAGDIANHGPWLARYSATGLLWFHQLPASGHFSVWGLAFDSSGGVFASGQVAMQAGGADAWIGRFSPDGTLSWIRQFGTPEHDLAVAITEAASGSVFAAGTTNGNLGAVFAGQSTHHHDAWIARFGCYSNCDGSDVGPVLNVDDFMCFINSFGLGLALPVAERVTHYANCDLSTEAPVLDVSDFMCFVARFAQGCP